ncbi:gluconokinase [Mucilaginibacter sp.]
MAAYLLGIDIGTGSTKAVAVDLDAKSIANSQHYYPAHNPQPGYSEQDPEIIFKAFVNCITDVVQITGNSPMAVSLSSAMHSVIPVDANCKPLAPMITWADSRSEDVAERVRNSAQGAEIYKVSGTPIHAMTPLCKIIWIKENQSDLFAATYKFISIKEYIWYQLFNVFEVDYAIASATGLFDIIKLDWNPEAYELAGISLNQLSKPVNTTYKKSALTVSSAQLLTLNADTQFVIGASDGCCANLGSYVTEPGVASLTIGTSGAVRITSKRPVYDYHSMIFNYLLNKDTFICGGAINNGGIVLDWLLKTFSGKNSFAKTDYELFFEDIAGIPAGSNGLLFLPYLYGERAPLWDTKSCGVFFNIKPIHTQAHFLRAGLEGICFALNDVIQSVERSSSTIERLHISGGFINSTVWVQMLADITQKKLITVQQEDASALGAIFLADDALGLNKLGKNLSDKNKISLLPDKSNTNIYNNHFLIFKKLYQDLKETMHLMHNSQ